MLSSVSINANPSVKKINGQSNLKWVAESKPNKMFAIYFPPINWLGNDIKYNHIPICSLVDFLLTQEKNLFF